MWPKPRAQQDKSQYAVAGVACDHLSRYILPEDACRPYNPIHFKIPPADRSLAPGPGAWPHSWHPPYKITIENLASTLSALPLIPHEFVNRHNRPYKSTNRVQMQKHDLSIRPLVRRWLRVLIVRIRPACKVGCTVLVPVWLIHQRNAWQLADHDLLQTIVRLLLHCRIKRRAKHIQHIVRRLIAPAFPVGIGGLSQLGRVRAAQQPIVQKVWRWPRIGPRNPHIKVAHLQGIIVGIV